jgi:hypothetical protein
LSAPARRALLIGCGTFTDPVFDRLRAPAADVAEMDHVLSSGRYRVTPVVGCTNEHARRAVSEFFAAGASGELNLLYISTHGMLDADGELHFVLQDSQSDDLAGTALAAAFVYERMCAGRATSRLVILDTCYSGRFAGGLRAKSATESYAKLAKDAPDGRGMGVLTSSGETKQSFEGDGRLSLFTDAVVAGIAAGGRVTFDSLYAFVDAKLGHGESGQRPQKLGRLEGDIVIVDTTIPGDPLPASWSTDEPSGSTVKPSAKPAVRARTRTGRAVNDGARSNDSRPTPAYARPLMAVAAAMIPIATVIAVIGRQVAGNEPDKRAPVVHHAPSTTPDRTASSAKPTTVRVKPTSIVVRTLRLTVDEITQTDDATIVAMSIYNNAVDTTYINLDDEVTLTESDGTRHQVNTHASVWGDKLGGGQEFAGTVVFDGRVHSLAQEVTISFPSLDYGRGVSLDGIEFTRS